VAPGFIETHMMTATMPMGLREAGRAELAGPGRAAAGCRRSHCLAQPAGLGGGQRPGAARLRPGIDGS
jgi:hypothetical protein